jgi:hypothetical protein
MESATLLSYSYVTSPLASESNQVYIKKKYDTNQNITKSFIKHILIVYLIVVIVFYTLYKLNQAVDII